MIRRVEYICVFLSGGIIYGIIEMLWRGYTHWSMTLAGGLCFLLLHWLNFKLRCESFIARCLLGCMIITAVEFAVGIAVNVWLGLDVWDYSDMRGNILGQVCPAFSALWFLLCIPAYLFSNSVRTFFGLISENERRTT